MPRTLKRRSDAISREEDTPDPVAGPSTETNGRRRQSSSVSSAGGASARSDSENEDETQGSTQTANLQGLAKKLIRLALSSEYSRNPLRRTDISQKIFKESNASPRLFKPVFNIAQKQLRDIFGMQMVELPSREKTTLKDRRTQATQASNTNSTTKSQSWILISTLPSEYKTNPTISKPTLAPSQEVEAAYMAMYTFILSLVFLNNSSLPEAKLERYLKRVNADTYTPFGSLDKLLQRMVKDGYIEKRRDTTSGEEVVEVVPGPRGKVEVGANGVAGLVRSVYGFGSVGLDGKHNGHNTGTNHTAQQDPEPADEPTEADGEATSSNAGPSVKIDRDDLEKRLKRSLGDTLSSGDTSTSKQAADPNAMDLDSGNGGPQQQQQQSNRPSTRRTRRRRSHDEDNDDEDDQYIP